MLAQSVFSLCFADMLCDESLSPGRLYADGCMVASVVGFPARAAVSFPSAEVAPSIELHMHCCKKTWSTYLAYRVYLKSDMQQTQHQSVDVSVEVSMHCILLHVLQTQLLLADTESFHLKKTCPAGMPFQRLMPGL